MHRTTRKNRRELNHRIEITPGKMSGQPCIRGTRITVGTIKCLLNRYSWTPEKIIAHYPTLTTEDVEAARLYHRWTDWLEPECR